jgi:amidase
VMLTPTMGAPPLPIGTVDTESANLDVTIGQLLDFLPFTTMANMTGQPAITLPLFWSADNLPIGSQLVGRFGDESLLLRLAAQLEAAQPWAHRHPPVWN